MPDSWAKALAPTIALFGWTGMPVICVRSREAWWMYSVLIPVWRPKRSFRVLMAMTTSSIALFPARSPIPLIVHSTWRAPFFTAASALAVASPRSLWQWTEMTAWRMFGTRAKSRRDQVAELLRDGIAHRVGDVDRRRPRGDDRLDHLAEIVPVAPGRVHRGELHVRGVAAGMGDRGDGLLEHLRARLAELVFEVDVRRRDEGVDPGRRRPGDGLPGAVDVGRIRPGERRDLAAPDLPGDLPHGGEIAVRGDRETGLDDIHAHFFELAGDPQFFVRVHARPRRLLAVPERRVKNKNPLSRCLHC